MTSFLAASPALAASDLDFYESLLRRGVAHFADGNLPVAASELHIAAFGLLERIDEYETAYVYLTIAAGRLHNDADVRTFVMRLLAAERVEPSYAALPIAQSLRQEFERLAVGVLTPAQLGVLHGPSTARPSLAQALPAAVPVPAPPPPPAFVAPEPVPQRAPVVVVSTPSPAAPSRQSNEAAKPPAPPKGSTVPSTSTQSITPAVTRPSTRSLAPVPVPAPAMALPRTDPLSQPAIPAPTAAPALAMAASDIRKAILDGQQALDDGDLGRARELYRPLLEASLLPHDPALQVGEGLYRTHDYTGAVQAFQRAGGFSRSEAQQQYDYAVSLYEIGRYGDAKRELAHALPSLEVTPEVARYRTRIEGAIE